MRTSGSSGRPPTIRQTKQSDRARASYSSAVTRLMASGQAPRRRRPCSQRHGFAEDLLGLGRRMPNLYHVDTAAERVLKIEDELAQVECRPSWLHINQKVDVAIS